MILLNDFKRMDEDIHTEIVEACERVFRSGWYILGDEVRRFEQDLAHYVNAKWAIGCGNGMDAIEIALRTLQLRPGEKVITTPLTAFATTLAIIRAGGIPVYVDVDPCGQIDLTLVEQLLQQDITIRFIVPVHLYGIPINLDALSRLKRKYHLIIVEDCAQAIGATYGNKLVGSVGHLSAVSFYPTKNLGAFGDAGAVWGSKQLLEKQVRMYRDYGQSKKYIHSVVGLNSRLDELQAALLQKQLELHLDSYIQRRQKVADFYYSHIKNKNIVLLPVDTRARSTWHLFPVLVRGSRRDFMNYCEANGVQTGIHYPVLASDQKACASFPKISVSGKLTKAKYFASHEVSLPIHPYLTDDEVSEVVRIVNNWK